MNTKTTIRIEYAVLALKPDGTWRTIKTACNPKEADKLLKDYLYCVEYWPKLYTRYEKYRIAKRTVITTIGEWQEVDE